MDSLYIRPGFDFALACLVEECGETLAAAGKTQRWGLNSVNPELPPERQETNRDWLLRELLDLDAAIQRVQATIKEEGWCATGNAELDCGTPNHFDQNKRGFAP